MIETNVKYLVGDPSTFGRQTFAPYDPLIRDFLADLSATLLGNNQVKTYPDVVSFGFWCRRQHVARLKEQFPNRDVRLGLGVVFHIAPSNVPVNFAFSFAFALLAGNSNIVRVPSKHFVQTDLIVEAIRQTLADPKYGPIAESTALVQYEKDDAITARFSKMCHARIIWGGDRTIRDIRRSPIPPRAREIAFADRYSFCAINAESILQCDESALDRLAEGFFNDTYLMDQNACSSPHLILWLGANEIAAEARDTFWESISRTALRKYALEPISAINKFTHLCEDAIERQVVAEAKRYGNHLYVLRLNQLPEHLDEMRGTCGYFHEYTTKDLNEIRDFVNESFQTLTYFGLERDDLVSFVTQNRLSGIDRIVPIGKAMDISIVWDGYDIVQTLSRICDIQ